MSRTLHKPRWRYKLAWLALSLLIAAVAGVFRLAQPSEVAQGILGFAVISATVAAAVIAWYAVLVGAGVGVRALVSGNDRKRKTVSSASQYGWSA